MAGYGDLRVFSFCGPGLIAPTIAGEMSRAFESLGADVMHVGDAKAGFRPERVIEEFRPDFIFTLDYMVSRANPARFEKYGIPHVTWFVDDPVLVGFDRARADDLFFVTDTGWESRLRGRGATRVLHLPLCANPELFRPCGDAAKLEPFRHSIGFLGSTRRTDELQKWLSYLKLGEDQVDLIRTLTIACVENPGAPFSELLESHAPALAPMFELPSAHVLKVHVLEEAAQWIRMQYVSLLGGRVHVYGDAGWKECEKFGVHTHGPLDPAAEAPLLYEACDISLNFHAGQLINAVNQRVFDVFAAGGFLLTDFRPDLERLFGADSGIAFFRSGTDMIEKADYYLERGDERRAVSERIRERILREHTYRHRAARILDVFVGTYRQ